MCPFYYLTNGYMLMKKMFICNYVKLVTIDFVIMIADESYLTNGYLDTKLDWIPGLKNFRLKDLPDYIRTTNANNFMLEYLIDMADNVIKAPAIVINTSEELESEALKALSSMLPSVYPIGPFPSFLNQSPHNHLESLASNLWKEDTEP